MIKPFFIYAFTLFSLIACSSVERAPVSDVTSPQNSHSDTRVRDSGRANYVGPKTYTVKKGDTLYGIAWKTGKEVNALIQFNNLKRPYLIHIGQKLVLTGDKQLPTKNTNNKSDLSSQNVNKNSNSDCTAQNCSKNNADKVAHKKTKAYSDSKVDKKSIAIKNETIVNKKVGGWYWPVKGKLTKKFSRSQSTMQGISIVNNRGSSIQATASGKVVYAGNGLRGYGNLIIIKHNYDYLSAYAHNETLLVRENEQVKMGQKIALMGDSGSDHVHLHFEIRYRGKAVDPLRYLPKK